MITQKKNVSITGKVTPDDAECIACVVSSSDPEAFAQLVRKYQSSVRQFLRRLSAGDHAMADDLAQETFLLAYQKISTYKGSGHFKGWLFKIAYRRFLRMKQTGAAKYEIISSDITLNSVSNDAVEADILAEKMMGYLTVEERVLITLNISEGMSHSEISQYTGISLGTIKSSIRRSKQKLIKEFSTEEQVA